jgi:hypothetical protein
MAEGKVIADKIHLIAVKVLKSRFEVHNPNDDHNEIFNLSTGLKSETAFNFEDKFIRFRLYILIQGLDNDEKKVGIEGEYCIEFEYRVDNLNDFVIDGDSKEEDTAVDSKEKVQAVDGKLGATIAGISYSTARGIILHRTQATEFNGVLLPVISPGDLLEEDTFSEGDDDFDSVSAQ